MKLAPLITLYVVSKPVEIGTGPQGTRSVFDATGGTFQGTEVKIILATYSLFVCDTL